MLAGMVVRIDAPDLALRQALVKSVALRKSILLSNEAVDAMACHCVSGAREIEGAFASLQAMCLVQNATHAANPQTILHTQDRNEISCGIIETLFQRENATRGTSPVRLSDIIEQVCLIMGIDTAQLAGESRHRHITLARALIAWLARHHTSMSFPEIARAMKRNSHSAIHSGATRIEKLIQEKATIDAGAAGTFMIVELLERLRLTLRNSQHQSKHLSQRNTARQLRA
jgi:chromosomal replication initiation ATPase DnaA